MAEEVAPATIAFMKGMRWDDVVAARMKDWNKELDLLNRDAAIRAWIGATNFDRWWSGKIAVRAEQMRRQGFMEVLNDSGVFEWKRIG